MKKKKQFPVNTLRYSNKLSNIDDINLLYHKASRYIDEARQSIRRSIDIKIVEAYWLIGRDIIKTEQRGERRAEYGKAILRGLSVRLQVKYKGGFSIDTLEKARKFFLTYQKSATLSRILTQNLSWSHYVELLKVKRSEARQFYIMEARRNNWNIRELRRQINAFLYDRTPKSKNKRGLLKSVRCDYEINTPEDAIKDPLVLEFLGVPEPRDLSETKLETALINNLQNFLLELGRGFAFVGRQKRLTFDNNHYYADLVFYHVILKCYVIVELVCHPVTHADLGQVQLYVNYFDSEVKQENDNPTIGLVLCTSKSDTMVKYMLGDKAKQIFASTYQFHLPTEKELEIEIKREIQKIEHQPTEDK